LRRPSLMCRHKLRCAQRRGPSATCPGFARFRRIFAGFSLVLVRFDCLILLYPASLLLRRNPPQALMAGAAGEATGRASGTRATRKQAARKRALKSAPAANCSGGSTGRSDLRLAAVAGPAHPNSPYRRTGRPGVLASAGSPKPSTG
jgi:hypothetical protein